MFLYTIYFLSIIIIVIGLIINTVYLMPLFVKLARVKNGLAKLRKLMLVQAVLNELLGISALLTLTLRFFIDGEFARYSITLFVLLFSLFFLALIGVWAIMFKQQFTPRQIELHEKIDKQEKKDDKAKFDNK